MKVSKELIEKYHDGTCSKQEKLLVETWLFSDESADELALSQNEEKAKLQTEMWAEIATILPKKDKKLEFFETTGLSIPLWRQVAAAVIFVGSIAAGVTYLNSLPIQPNIVVMNNSSDTINKDLNAKEYSISVGPKSNVEINNETGIIDFCGAVKINPKKDIEFTLQGKCINPSNNAEKIFLKKGLSYIALNYSNASNNNEVIILEEGSMMGLPPLIVKQLIQQFNI